MPLTSDSFEFIYKKYRRSLRGLPIVPRTVLRVLMDDANTVADGEKILDTYLESYFNELLNPPKETSDADKEQDQADTAE